MITLHEAITIVFLAGTVGYFIGYHDGRINAVDSYDVFVAAIIMGMAVISATVAVTLRVAG